MFWFLASFVTAPLIYFQIITFEWTFRKEIAFRSDKRGVSILNNKSDLKLN